MKNLTAHLNSRKQIRVDESLDLSKDQQMINECVVAARKIDIDGDKTYVIVKHRDRNYKPSLSIIHTVVNGMEIAYLRDDTTLWSEGMNAAGIAIVNSALAVDADENMVKLTKKADTAPKFSKDGERIIKALTMNNIDDAVFFAKNFKGGIQGHTIFSDGDEVYTMEMTSQHPAVVTKLDGLDTVVRTNIGLLHADAGYQEGIGKKSSVIRREAAEKMLDNSNTEDEILTNLRGTPYAKNSQLNPMRNTSGLFTSTQLLMNPKTKSFHLVLLKDKIENFKGIVDQMPTDFEAQIKITYDEQ